MFLLNVYELGFHLKASLNKTQFLDLLDFPFIVFLLYLSYSFLTKVFSELFGTSSTFWNCLSCTLEEFCVDASAFGYIPNVPP